MIQAKPYEFMVKYTPQNEWIERRGILLWLASFFVELGAGAFLVASLFGSLPGMFIGWLLCGVLGGGLHLLFLGHPSRFWRMILSSGWKTSWISRGMIFVMLFLILGAINLILIQWASPVSGWLIIADVFSFCTIVYIGFVMNYVNSIPLWNTPLLPVLYVILGIWGGLGVTLVALLSTGATAGVGSVEGWSRIFLLAFIFIVFVYLFSIRYQGATGKISVRQMVSGRWAPLFWIMVVILGMALPVAVILGSGLAGLRMPAGLLYLAVTLELLSDLVLRYCILRCGLYAPLIPARIS